MTSKDPDYKGCAWSILVLWSDGSKTWEPLTLMIKQDPVRLVAFVKENDFLILCHFFYKDFFLLFFYAPSKGRRFVNQVVA